MVALILICSKKIIPNLYVEKTQTKKIVFFCVDKMLALPNTPTQKPIYLSTTYTPKV